MLYFSPRRKYAACSSRDSFAYSGRKNAVSMRERFCPDPLAGFEKMAGISNIFLPKNEMFQLITWKEQAICLPKLTFSLLNFLEA